MTLLQNKVGLIRNLRSRGLNRERIADALQVTSGQMRWVMAREGMDRWDVSGVLMVELYAEFPTITSGTVLKLTRETLGITPAMHGSGALFVTPRDAGRIREHITELFRRRDAWLTATEAARLIGVSPVTLSAAVTRGFTWASALERCTVPSKRHWGYRYEPESVRTAAQRRNA